MYLFDLEVQLSALPSGYSGGEDLISKNKWKRRSKIWWKENNDDSEYDDVKKKVLIIMTIHTYFNLRLIILTFN